jgi:hypothetical protein
MAIQNIKEIINNRGYVINPDDRKIFQDGDLQSFFGFSESDAIEFVIYDVNNNQLPQSDGSLVKYIPLTNDNINDYFLVPNGSIFQKYQLPKEYFIDIERLMGEAGYTNGIFKTQVTLINKRAGSDKQKDKLWIQEISPSRTEIRLFPLKEGIELNPELKTRYDAFVNDREFREDTISYVIEFIENIKPTEISTFLRSKYQKVWLDNLVNEFKIQNFELFVNTIYQKFVQSCIYEFTNRISDLGNLNYGKPKSTKPSIVLSKELVITLCKKILTETINYYLPRQDNRTQTNTLAAFDASLDEVSDILQRSESDTVYNSKPVEIVFTQVSASAVSVNAFTLNTLIQNTGASNNNATADDASPPAPPPPAPPPPAPAPPPPPDSMSPGNADLFAQDATSGKGPVYGWAPGVVPGGPPKAAIP